MASKPIVVFTMLPDGLYQVAHVDPDTKKHVDVTGLYSVRNHTANFEDGARSGVFLSAQPGAAPQAAAPRRKFMRAQSSKP